MNNIQTKFKIKDNKAIIISKVNRQRLSKEWSAPLLTKDVLKKMIKVKMDLLGCSELEATEILKKELIQ